MLHSNRLPKSPVNCTYHDLVNYDEEQSLPHTGDYPDRVGQGSVIQDSSSESLVLRFDEVDDISDSSASQGTPQIFVIQTVESFLVANEYQIEELLKFIDLLQDDAERDNMAHTGSSGTESRLLSSESRIDLLLHSFGVLGLKSYRMMNLTKARTRKEPIFSEPSSWS